MTFKEYVSFCLMLVAGVLAGSEAWASEDPPEPVCQVLVLNSYHPEYVWEDSVIEGIRSVFTGAAAKVDLRYEYMDTKHYRPEVVFEPLRELYALKYAEITFDVIIASDDNVLNFLLLYRDALFPGAPVVFCGINGFTREMIEGHVGFTGFAESFDLKSTLEIALKNHPGTRHFAVVSGTSTSSRINQRKFREVKPLFEDRVSFIDLTLLNPPELKERLTALPEHTVILYLSYYKMPDGSFLTVAESTSFVFKHSKLPMYSPWEYTMGNGVIGGMTLSGKKEGRKAARYAVRLLNGESLDNLPLHFGSENTPTFDYKMLDYFDIPMSRLPEGSLIKNEPQTLYYKYKYWIIGISAFILYQTLTIFWLSRNLIRRRIAEKLQKQLEEQLLHSQKMEAIGTFAGGISHDLNNILGAITTCSEIAIEDVSDHSPVHDDLKHILNAANRGKDLIRQVLDFSRKRDHERGPVSLEEILKECIALLKLVVPPSIEIRLHISGETGYVLASPAKLHQVIMNLCTNAEQAMRGRQGRLAISLDQVTIDARDPVLTVDLKPGPYERLTVSDTGSGMDKSLQTRIFEPFFTTKKQGEGTGLGLAVIHGIVTRYGGAIFVESIKSRGSCFTVYLPRMETTAPMQEDRELFSVPDGCERILLVDDDADMLYSQEKLLKRLGYTVQSYLESSRALETVRADPHGFDLVITDQKMPVMTGMELALKIKGCRGDLPIILYSGHFDENDSITPQALEDNGISEFIKKPFTREDISKTIRRALERHN